MSDNTGFYKKYGRKAAQLSFFFPGLGQLHNKHYVRGMLVIITFTFSVAFLLLMLTRPSRAINPTLTMALTVLPFIIWLFSMFDAYQSAIEERRKNARRYSIQVLTTIRGLNTEHVGFEEVAMTKNLSKLGACLIMSTEINEGSQLFLEFEGKSKSQARVIWLRETGNRDERLVGVELLKPLEQL